MKILKRNLKKFYCNTNNKKLNENDLKQELELFLKLDKELKKEGMFNVKN